MKISPTNLCDGYKLDHRRQYPDNTTLVYSNFTPRKSRIPEIEEIVFFGLQYFIKKYLIEDWNKNFFEQDIDKICDKYENMLNSYLGPSLIGTDHIKALHKLGYLPIRIKAVPEGYGGKINEPLLTICNTKPEFFWITNFLETILSCVLWKPCTSATIANQYKKVFNKYADETCNDRSFVPFQGHDFSFRGMSGLEDACMSGAAHLLSFVGTDTIPAIDFLEHYYKANRDNELVGCSVPATEHSVACLNADYDENGEFLDEYNSFKRLITEVYPRGIVSIVSDSFDFWKVVSETLPALKKEIEERGKQEGINKVVIRPDSGNPVDIICGNTSVISLDNICETVEECSDYMLERIEDTARQETPHGKCGDENGIGYFRFNNKVYEIKIDIFWDRHDKQYYYIESCTTDHCIEINLSPEQKGLIECLWDTFGGTVNTKGYKELNPCIGSIYGDSITLEIQKQILEKLKEKGFASNNLVFGIGSYTYQYVTRDTFGFVMKATYGEVEGVGKNIYKKPKTGAWKTSHKGLLSLTDKRLKQECSWEEEDKGLLTTVFIDGKIIQETSLYKIRITLSDAIK